MQFGFVINFNVMIIKPIITQTAELLLSLAHHIPYVKDACGGVTGVRIKLTSVPITFTAPGGFFTCTSLDFPRSFETESDLNPILSNFVINSKT